MQLRNYQIVGLRHNAWQGDSLAQRLRGADGRRVVLMREETNEWNREATAAYIDTEMVGYVADLQCRESSAYCDMADCQLLVGSVTAVDSDHQRLTVTVAVSGTLPERQDETALYDLWERNYHTAPLMAPTADEQRLLLLRRDLLRLLPAATAVDDTLRRDLEVYAELMACDVSREATDDRCRIVSLLVQSAVESLRLWGRRLEVAVTALGSPESRQRLADHIFCRLPESDAFRQMAVRHGGCDLAGLEAQLRLFPHDLYDEYCLSRSAFASKLYYRRIPARPLRSFLSGLLLLDYLRGRAPAAAQLSQRQQTAVADALAYVSRIAHCAAPAWRDRIDALWRRLAADYGERIGDVQRLRSATFNRRFVCRLVGTLLQQGVYRQDVAQTEYTRLLEGSGHSNLRKEVNQGVDDECVRQSVRQLLRAASA